MDSLSEELVTEAAQFSLEEHNCIYCTKLQLVSIVESFVVSLEYSHVVYLKIKAKWRHETNDYVTAVFIPLPPHDGKIKKESMELLCCTYLNDNHGSDQQSSPNILNAAKFVLEHYNFIKKIGRGGNNIGELKFMDVLESGSALAAADYYVEHYITLRA
ncbi:hypothetical protein FRX31_017198, partial [Thalictrum thalictroides]